MTARRNTSAIGSMLQGAVLGTLALLMMSSGCLQAGPSIPRGPAADLGASPWKSKKKLWARAEASLSQLPGVVKVLPVLEGELYVFTDNPAVVPQEFDGIPIKTFPARQWRPPS
jgi:hypothetical protein